MKRLIYSIIVFIVSICLFYPRAGSTEINNLPLLLVILFLIFSYFVYRFFKFLFIVFKLKVTLRKKDFKIKRIHFLFSKGYIIAENREQVLDICLLFRKRRYYRYHFSNDKTIEFFKTSRSVALTSKRGSIARGEVYTRCVGKQKLKWYEDAEKRFILFDKMPNEITDSVKKENIGVGEKICGSNVYIFDLKTLEKLLNEV